MARPLQGWRVRALVVGACLSLAAAVAGLLPAVARLEAALDLELLFFLRGARPAPAEVLIVPIDARAAASLHLPGTASDFERCAEVSFEPRPGYRTLDPPELLARWPRCLHARVLEALAVGEPDAVVMDISFRPRSDPSGIFAEQDRVLAAAMRRAGKVVVVRRLIFEDGNFAGAQPLAGEIEAAAAAVAPFLLLGDRLQRADRFCAFLDDGHWLGACLPAMAHQVVSANRVAAISFGEPVRYFNFYGPPGSFRALRYEQLAAGGEGARPAPGSLRGKVVFMGFAELARPEAVEHFHTPFTTAESVKLSGVELAATAYANLEDGSAVRPVARWARVVAVVAFSMLCTALWVALPAGLAAAGSAIAAAAYLGGAGALFAWHALWLPLALPLGIAAPLAIGAGFVARYRQVKRERDRGLRWMGLTLPASVVQRALGADLQPAQLRERVQGACLNTDIRNWTGFAAGKPPERVGATLARYFDALVPVVYACGAHWDDKAGDGMMALWLDRQPGPGVRASVCEAALAVGEAAERFRRAQGAQELATRIGVHYGPMVMDMVGAPPHFDYRAIGDPPNAAQRLQELNKTLGTRLLVSAAAMEGVAGFVYRELGCFLLRGRERDPMEVRELLGRASGVAPATLALRAAFEAALAAYRAGRREEARERFGRLAAGGDGPSTFYAELCARGAFHGSDPIAIG